MLGATLVAIHKRSAEVSVGLMQVEAHGTGQQRRGLVDILAQLVDVAGASGEIAGGHDAARCRYVAFEAHNVVGLPAMERDGSFFKGFDGLVGIYAQGGVALLGKRIGFFNVFRFHIVCFFIDDQ